MLASKWDVVLNPLSGKGLTLDFSNDRKFNRERGDFTATFTELTKAIEKRHLINN